MQLDYAIEGYWLAKRRDFSAHTVSDYQLTFRSRHSQNPRTKNKNFGG